LLSQPVIEASAIDMLVRANSRELSLMLPTWAVLSSSITWTA
jgi:hypothetical protein